VSLRLQEDMYVFLLLYAFNIIIIIMKAVQKVQKNTRNLKKL